jgi:hypothetical protein
VPLIILHFLKKKLWLQNIFNLKITFESESIVH